jgi:hypothetical protein
MRPGKARGNYLPDWLFVHECGRMAALANRAGTGKAGQIRPIICEKFARQGYRMWE